MKINRHLKTLLIGGNIWYFGEGMFGPLLAIFAERIGGSILDISYAWATFLIIAGIMQIIIGRYTDRHDNKEKIMMLGYSLNAIFTFGYLLVHSPYQLFIVQAGLGIAAAMATPTWNALYAKHENKKEDGYEWGLASGSSQVVIGIAIIIGGYILNYTSFTTLFITMGIIQVIATIYQAKILKDKKR